MATIKDQMTGEKLTRHSSFKDRFYFRQWRGKMVVATKPSYGKKVLSERQAVAVDKFKQASQLAKLAAPSQQVTADELSKGTQYFARDLIFMAMYGTLGFIQLTDGRKLFSVAANRNVSELIDALAQTFGDMLFRAEDGWERIPLGDDEWVLTIINGRPMWAPAQGGSGGDPFEGFTQAGSSLARSGSAYRCKASDFVVDQPVKVTSLAALVSNVSPNPQVGCQLVRLVGDGLTGEVADVLYTSDFADPWPNQWQGYRFPVAGEIVLEPGVVYAVAVTTPPPPVGIYCSVAVTTPANNVIFPNGPWRYGNHALQYTENLLVPGSEPAAIGAASYVAWINGLPV